MSCNKCDNGWISVYDDSDKTWRMKRCDCFYREIAYKRLQKSGLSMFAEKYTFENFKVNNEWQNRVKEKAKTYLDNNDKQWFFIGGQSGSGKTHICTAIAVNLINKGFCLEYMLWREASMKIKAVANDYSEYAKQVSGLQTAHILYIDDLFKGGVTEADVRLAFELIDGRYRRNLPTIISSELLTHEIARIDEAICGRIKERAKGYVMNLLKHKDRNYRL